MCNGVNAGMDASSALLEGRTCFSVLFKQKQILCEHKWMDLAITVDIGSGVLETRVGVAQEDLGNGFPLDCETCGGALLS